MKLISLPHTAPDIAHRHIYVCVYIYIYIYIKGNEMILKHDMMKGSVSLQIILEGRLRGDSLSERRQSFGLLQYSKICTLLVDNQALNDTCIKKIRNQGHSTLHTTAGEGKLNSCHSLFAAQVPLLPIDLHSNCQ